MKFLYAILASLFLSFTATWAQSEMLTPEQAAGKIGEMVCVKATVESVYKAKGSAGTPYFLNTAKHFVDNKINIVIFNEVRQTMGDIDALTGKEVLIRGEVSYYHHGEEGRSDAQIIIREAGQIQFLDSVNAPYAWISE